MKKYTHFILAAVVVLTMPLLMHSGSLASEVLIFALAAMGCNLLLGVALIAVSLWMQRGLWGLGEMLWRKLQGQRNTATAATAKGEQA